MAGPGRPPKNQPVNELARELFIKFADLPERSHRTFAYIVDAAFEAAELFHEACEQRRNPKAVVEAESPATT